MSETRDQPERAAREPASPEPASREHTSSEHTESVGRDRRERARRDRRQQWAVVVVALVVGLVAGSLGTSRDRVARALGATPSTTAPRPPTPARTVLIAHIGTTHRLDLLAVAGVGVGGRVGSVVFVPTTTLVEVPSFDTQALLDVPRLGQSTLLATTVANALGLHFDQVLVVSNAKLTALLAPAHRLNVTFGRSVQVDDAAGTLAFTTGRAVITAADATRLLIGSSTVGTLDRLVTVQAVLEGWFAALRTASVARATERVTSAAKSLVELAHAEVGFDTMPVDVLSSGSTTRYELRQPDADQLIRADFPFALLAPGKRPRVEILNGTGAISLAQAVAQKIVPAGGEITLTGNVPGFGVRRTSVVYYRSADLPAARRIAAALGVGSVAEGNIPIDVVDLTVVVGADFHPKRH
jgi:LytR cell envelope-related transcriptional attenuator